jgi:lysophospholipase L1-like esterase
MRFRLFLIGCTALCLAVLLRLSVHVSFHARVLGRYSVPYFALLVGLAAVAVGTVGFHHPVFYRRLHRVRWPLVLGLATAAMLLAAAEISVRVFDPFGISHFEESSKLWLDYVSDPLLVFRLPPHTRKTYQGVMISTNALGFRDREIERKQDGELRILLLGDSITFGYGVSDEETYGRKLESILTSELGRKVRTVNAGMGGFNTVQEAAFLENQAAAIDPDVVSLLYLPNDIDSNIPPFHPGEAIYGNASKVTRILLEKSWLFRLAVFASTEPEPKRLAEVGIRGRGAKDSLTALARIAALCRQRRVPFETFFYREKEESGAGARFIDELFSQVSRVGVENGFLVTDVRPWWGNRDWRSLTNSVVDWHPNARGHDVLASGIATVLLSREVLPKPVAEKDDPSQPLSHSTGFRAGALHGYSALKASTGLTDVARAAGR